MSRYSIMYIIPFQSLSGDNFEIWLEGLDYTGQQYELIAGGTPFVIETDTVDVLAPIRASTATISVYGSDYLRSMYTSNPQGVRVKLWKKQVPYGIELMWLGYLTPDTFSQDFSHPEFIYEMECVSALSTLKHKEFDETADTTTFFKLIMDAAKLAGYDKVYLTKALTGKNGENIYQSSYISCGNFYDELGKPMTYYEILENLAKYLVCSVFLGYKDTLLLVDYHAIRSGINDYYYYDTVSYDYYSSDTVSQEVSSSVIGYRGTGAKISRIAGKNKATVKCSLYEIDDILPAFDEEFSEFSRMETYEDNYNEGQEQKRNEGMVRYYKQPKFTFYKYDFGTGTVIATEHSDPLVDNQIGSCFVRTASYDALDKPNKINFDNEVLVRAWNDSTGTQRIPVGLGKVLTIKSKRRIIVNSDTYFCLNFSIKYIASIVTKGSEGLDIYQPRGWGKFTDDAILKVPCILKVGNYIYNGTSWDVITGTNGSTSFIVEITLKKDNQATGVYFQVDNTNDFTNGLGDLSGYLVNPLPEMVTGWCEFTLLMPDGYGTSSDRVWNSRYMYVRDISVEHGQSDPSSIYDDWVKEGVKNDLIYENEINDDYIDEAEEIELKICTNQANKLALSSVYSGGQYQKEIVSATMGTDIPEHLILKKVIDTFNSPRFTISPTLSNTLTPYCLITDDALPNNRFVFAGGKEDVKMESIETNLIEL